MKKYLFSFLMVTVLMAACTKVAFTGRKQMKLLPESELIAMSLTEYNSFLGQNTLSKNASQTAVVREVGQNIQKAAEQYYAQKGLSKQLAGFKWEFNLVQNDQVNAWCMPGGKVVVYTGILPVVQNSDAMAVLMGHEIAHALAFHGNERMSQLMAAQLGGIALDIATQDKPQETRQLLQLAYGVGTQLGALLPFSRKHESEADEIGLYLAAMAGYDVTEAAPFWQRMNRLGGGSMPAFLSTHPDPGTRSAKLQKLVPKAQVYQQKYGTTVRRPRVGL
jgi:predicted Zn-dependent protease